MYQIYAEKCFGQIRPEGLTELPDFSWRLESDGFEIRQAAYRIRVFNADLQTVWDTGRVVSDQQHNIPYEGPALSSSSDYFWQVTSFSSAVP